MLQNYIKLNICIFLQKLIKNYILEVDHFSDELKISVHNKKILFIIQFLKSHTHALFNTVIDITAYDNISNKKRFGVVYLLLSTAWNKRIHIEIKTDEVTWVPTITPIFSGANWCEREVFDLFGIIFENHPDLRRILTDYGFQGHPLRKDFPVTGFVEVRFDENSKSIVYNTTSLAQEFKG